MCHDCNWPLDKKEDHKKGFYCHGKFFEKLEEMLEYAEKYPDLPLNEEDFFMDWEYLGKEIFLNAVTTYGKDLQNKHIREILECMMYELNKKDLNFA